MSIPHTSRNTRVVLASRPVGWVSPENFRIEEVAPIALGDGQILVRNRFLSLDPYMRGRMGDQKSYAAKVEIGEVMIGGGVGEIVESKHAKLSVGDHVTGMFGWQELATVNGDAVRKVDPTRGPLSAHLGVLGMPGVTAHLGLFKFGEPKAGETVVVSAAAGAVGSLVGQLAKQHGCRAVGIAGGARKCEHVVRELGFDACIDYKTGNFAADLASATPNGIDVLFENVGGPVMDGCLRRLNAFARMPLCGQVSQYNETEPYGVQSFTSLLVNRVRVQGFIVSEHLDHWPVALGQLARLLGEKKLVVHESIAHGLRNAPAAFIGMLKGENVGKQLVALD